jgi:hypothetical protein
MRGSAASSAVIRSCESHIPSIVPMLRSGDRGPEASCRRIRSPQRLRRLVSSTAAACTHTLPTPRQGAGNEEAMSPGADRARTGPGHHETPT